ncbi:hypothetical protein [Chryseobacterium gambrini]|uniref:Uncharacterized protein n=1 Tax=Chryseobacterium gambrini TaxID=373672 RepID=A0A1N7MES6_9FLAO|nr:hypothetical protein [Chryseobacterium gambrini]SIS84604.1 hypothetical protein SAMN05421785_103171 [Chryseobacterium gambrini]
MKNQEPKPTEKQLSFDFQNTSESDENHKNCLKEKKNNGKIISLTEYFPKKERNYTNFIIRNTKSF